MREALHFSPPPGFDPPLWRYLSAPRFGELARSSTLYFCRADLLGDPFEGSYPPRQDELRRQFYEGATEHYLHEGLPNDAQLVRQLAHVSCWHMGDHESEHMWHRYGDHSVAVTSSVSRLRAAVLDDDAEFLLRPVEYIDFDTHVIWEGNVFNALFVKRHEYRGDQEFRVIRQSIERIGDLAARRYESPPGIRVRVDTRQLIESVVLHPRLDAPARATVIAAAASAGAGDRVRASSLAATPSF